MVDVEIATLNNIKNALNEFSGDISAIFSSACEGSDSVLRSCLELVKNSKIDLDQSSEKIGCLTAKLNELSKNLAFLKSEIDKYTRFRIAKKNEIASLNYQVQELENQIALLHSKLSQAEDEETRYQIRQDINVLNSQLSNLEGMISTLNDEIASYETKISDLEAKVKETKTTIDKTENIFREEKRRNGCLSNKYERLNNAYRKVEDESRTYTQKMKRFVSNSNNQTEQNISLLDTCISTIDSYLSVSL